MRTTILLSSVALLSLNLHTYAQRPAIFYVADPAALNVSEQMVVDRLTVMGFTVTPIDDNLSDPSDATGQELIVISSTVGSGNIATKHTATAVPIVNWEVNLLDELGIQSNNANGISITASQIQI